MAKVRYQNKFDNNEYSHMKMFPLLKGATDGRVLSEYTKRAPFFMHALSRYGIGVIQYIILVYDKQSPLRVIYPLLDQRKEEAAILAEIHRKPYYSGIADFSDPFFVDALSDFLKMRDDIVWSLIIQNEEVFYSNQRQILSQIQMDGKDSDRLKAAELQGKLLTQQNQIRKELKLLYAEFTGNDGDAEIAMKDRRPFAPEVVSNLTLHDEEE